jgi:hypothetical protein
VEWYTTPKFFFLSLSKADREKKKKKGQSGEARIFCFFSLCVNVIKIPRSNRVKMTKAPSPFFLIKKKKKNECE